MQTRRAFTLIEMLVVIAIIAVLAGMIFKMVQIAKRNADKANTIAKLEKLAMALNEFKAEYGIYPPVQDGICTVQGYDAEEDSYSEHSDCNICFQFENVTGQPDWLANNYFNDYPDNGPLFSMGLVAYLVERDRPGIVHKHASSWTGDTDRDKVAKKKWARFLDGVLEDTGTSFQKIEATPYFNSYITIKDSWDNMVRYYCPPPYLSYKLWSKGPDEADGTADDIHRDKWDN